MLQMLKKWAKQMLEDMDKMTDASFREGVFASVFNNKEGELVLSWLDLCYKITQPDLSNPNDVYFRLGRQSVVNHIRNILKQAKETK